MANDTKARSNKEAEVSDVDILAGLPWKGEAATLDPDEDAWERSALVPPTPKIWKVELGMQKSQLVKYDPKNEKTWSYVIDIEGRITEDGDMLNVPMFLRVSTYIKRGHNTSTAYSALVKLGFRKDLEGKQLRPDQIATALAKQLAKAPTALWENDWRASYQDAKGKWHNVCDTYAEFPDDPDNKGAKKSTFEVTAVGGGKIKVDAQNQVINWVEKGQPAISVRTEKAGASVVAGELDLEEPTPMAIKANGAVPTAAKNKATPAPVVAEDELSLD